MEQKVRPVAPSPTLSPTQPRQGILHASLSPWSLETECSCAGGVAARGQSESGNTNPLEENTWRCPSLALKRLGYLSLQLLAWSDFVAQETARKEEGKMQSLLWSPGRLTMADHNTAPASA